jgi:hypothetical protein
VLVGVDGGTQLGTVGDPDDHRATGERTEVDADGVTIDVSGNGVS